MHCAGGVILADNILLKHSLKVDLGERSRLLHFLSVVARLMLHTESLGPLWAFGTVSAPCLRRLPHCVYMRGGVGGGRKIISLTQGGVLGLPILLPPLMPPSLHWRSHKCAPMAALLLARSPALTSIRLVKP